jgi:hypothetical protein
VLVINDFILETFWLPYKSPDIVDRTTLILIIIQPFT